MRFGNVRLLWKLFVFLPFLGILLTGCWDRQEIEERAVVLGIGIDDAGEGATLPRKRPPVQNIRAKFL